MSSTLTVPRRFNGPPGSGNGGWFAGRVAALLAAPVTQVRLQRPPPLEVPLGVEVRDDEVLVASAEGLIATATAGPPLAPDPGPRVPYAEAHAAGVHFPGAINHPFDTCFSCGTARSDGLGLRPGEIAPGRYAAAWLALETGPEIVWAALDCPGGWAIGFPDRLVLLGTISGAVEGLPEDGEECVVTAWAVGSEGRKHRSGTAAYGHDGRLLGRADAVWIEIDPSVVG